MPKVLVVDDSALMRRLVSNVLTEAGYEVDTARNGAEGIERVTDWQPDVVTLDVNMPEMDGLTALSLIMQARPTPVIMLSSLTEQGARVTLEALALGAVDYIPKPGGTISLSVDDVADQLLQKVRAASRARPRYRAAADAGTRSGPSAAAARPASAQRLAAAAVARARAPA
ncbi:MAG: response regulator, partial [Aquincola sp.]|nr:response regulator [Aquincola sp.]